MLRSMTRSIDSRLLFAAVAAVGFAGASAAHATVVSFTAPLSGPAESPPNASPGTGLSQVDFDTVAHTMHVHTSFSGLLGNTTASHIHSATAVPGAGTAIVATQLPSFTGFPLGVTSGTFDNTFDMTLASSYNPAFITAHGATPASAEAFLLQSCMDGTAYMNVHSTSFPGGEIRGFLQVVPAPGTAALLALGGVLATRRRRN
jgi:hypothetical protein